MEKRYQVFVSSTFEDLQEERKEVMQALLELDCIPSGMELFPASNEDQWSLIQRVIDDCDYYILIIGGRYGSTNEDGISYTEMEYRYVLETNKPIIAFLHKNPENIVVGKTDRSEEAEKKLEDFRGLAEKKMAKHWTTPSELGGIVSRSMVKLIKQFPAIGWVKADKVLSEDVSKELLKLRIENDELKKRIILATNKAPEGTENLSNGEDETEVILHFIGKDKNGKRWSCEQVSTCSWNELFSKIAPHMLQEAEESLINNILLEYIKSKELENIKKDFKTMISRTDYKIDVNDFQVIKVQFRALGLICKSEKSRSIKDNGAYWKLTEYGDYIMTKLIAVNKPQ